jgi:hypothetical protein
MVCQQMMGFRKRCRSFAPHLLRRTLLIATFISMVTSSVRADGGTVLWQRTTGPFEVTFFTAQMPLRRGPVDLSVMLEEAGETRPIVDARVFIQLENEAGKTVRVEATHGQARNKLMYCSLINLPEAGHWKMKLVIEHGDERAEVLDHLMVANPQPMLIAYWKLMAFPLIMIVLFIINQWLRRETAMKGGGHEAGHMPHRGIGCTRE